MYNLLGAELQTGAGDVVAHSRADVGELGHGDGAAVLQPAQKTIRREQDSRIAG